LGIQYPDKKSKGAKIHLKAHTNHGTIHGRNPGTNPRINSCTNPIIMKIHILASTDRPNSYARKISEYTSQWLQSNTEASTTVFLLEDYPTEEVVSGNYGKPSPRVKEYNESFLDADGHLFVVPEYNGSYPGILKLFIDYLPFPESFFKRPVSFIGESQGAFGALRTVEHLQGVFGYRNAIVYPERTFIRRVKKHFDPEKGLDSELHQTLLENQLTGFVDFTARFPRD
jgi:NAD(P)H-dependent FMN reductase